MAEVSMFDELTSANAASHWVQLQQDRTPFIGETLFPDDSQDVDYIQFYRGQSRAVKPLQPSALDAQAIVRDRQGLERLSTYTNFFKESHLIDEKLRQDLARLEHSYDTARRDIVMEKIFNDSDQLFDGAMLTREIQRMQVLLTGKYAITGNGQDYHDDYFMKDNHQAQAIGKWGEDDSNPVEDIEKAIDLIGDEQNVTLTRMLMNRATFHALLRDEQIKATTLANTGNIGSIALSKKDMLAYLSDEFGLSVEVYTKGWTDATGAHKFIPDGKVVFMPGETLGRTVSSPTPEEADLKLSKVADVSLAGNGVAVTVMPHADPVTREIKVSQRYTITYEKIDSVYVLDAFNPKA
jgi:hypothetical protein